MFSFFAFLMLILFVSFGIYLLWSLSYFAEHGDVPNFQKIVALFLFLIGMNFINLSYFTVGRTVQLNTFLVEDTMKVKHMFYIDECNKIHEYETDGNVNENHKIIRVYYNHPLFGECSGHVRVALSENNGSN